MTMGRLFGRRDRERERRDELLSAYLDGELSAEERVRLEAQLATDPVLQAELDALRRTVTLVRDLPLVPISRNFILPQTMAARPRPAPSVRHRRVWAAPFLTVATAVVSLMFVVVLAGDLLLSGAGGLATAPVAEQVMEMEAPSEARELLPAEQVVAEAEIAVTVEVENVEKAGTEEILVPGAMPTDTLLPAPAEVPPAAEPTATAVMEAYAVEVSGDVSATAPAMGGGGTTVETEDTSTAPPTATAAPRADEEGLELAPREAAPGALEAEAEYGPPPTVALPWRVVEVVLGLATLGLALATIWAWRTRHQ